MKKLVRYIPHIIVAVVFLFMGAIGKLTGHPQSVELFNQLQLFGLDPMVTRLGLGILELLVVIGLFCKKTEKIAAATGTIIMIVALYVHAALLGWDTSIMAWVGLAANFLILVENDCKHCKIITCTPDCKSKQEQA